MSSKDTKTVHRLIKRAESIQRQMDSLASELKELQLEIKKEEKSSQLQVGDLVMISSRDRYGTRCVVNNFTAKRVRITTVDTNEKLIRKQSNLKLLKRNNK